MADVSQRTPEMQAEIERRLAMSRASQNSSAWQRLIAAPETGRIKATKSKRTPEQEAHYQYLVSQSRLRNKPELVFQRQQYKRGTYTTPSAVTARSEYLVRQAVGLQVRGQETRAGGRAVYIKRISKSERNQRILDVLGAARVGGRVGQTSDTFRIDYRTGGVYMGGILRNINAENYGNPRTREQVLLDTAKLVGYKSGVSGAYLTFTKKGRTTYVGTEAGTYKIRGQVPSSARYHPDFPQYKATKLEIEQHQYAQKQEENQFYKELTIHGRNIEQFSSSAISDISDWYKKTTTPSAAYQHRLIVESSHSGYDEWGNKVKNNAAFGEEIMHIKATIHPSDYKIYSPAEQAEYENKNQLKYAPAWLQWVHKNNLNAIATIIAFSETTASGFLGIGDWVSKKLPIPPMTKAGLEGKTIPEQIAVGGIGFVRGIIKGGTYALASPFRPAQTTSELSEFFRPGNWGESMKQIASQAHDNIFELLGTFIGMGRVYKGYGEAMSVSKIGSLLKIERYLSKLDLTRAEKAEVRKVLQAELFQRGIEPFKPAKVRKLFPSLKEWERQILIDYSNRHNEVIVEFGGGSLYQLAGGKYRPAHDADIAVRNPEHLKQFFKNHPLKKLNAPKKYSIDDRMDIKLISDLAKEIIPAILNKQKRKLLHIEAKTAATKKEAIALIRGENINPTGMGIRAIYKDFKVVNRPKEVKNIFDVNILSLVDKEIPIDIGMRAKSFLRTESRTKTLLNQAKAFTSLLDSAFKKTKKGVSSRIITIIDTSKGIKTYSGKALKVKEFELMTSTKNIYLERLPVGVSRKTQGYLKAATANLKIEKSLEEGGKRIKDAGDLMSLFKIQRDSLMNRIIPHPIRGYFLKRGIIALESETEAKMIMKLPRAKLLLKNALKGDKTALRELPYATQQKIIKGFKESALKGDMKAYKKLPKEIRAEVKKSLSRRPSAVSAAFNRHIDSIVRGEIPTYAKPSYAVTARRENISLMTGRALLPSRMQNEIAAKRYISSYFKSGSIASSIVSSKYASKSISRSLSRSMSRSLSKSVSSSASKSMSRSASKSKSRSNSRSISRYKSASASKSASKSKSGYSSSSSVSKSPKFITFKKKLEEKVIQVAAKILKARKFIYIPDLYSIIFGIRASAAERAAYLSPGRIFTGLEARKMI